MDLVPAMGARPRCPVKVSAAEASGGLSLSHLGVTTWEIGVKKKCGEGSETAAGVELWDTVCVLGGGC